ncbi:MAG: DUF2961 domain-containing protein [Clostridia bacterium]|nr:DUF2961 domain-containing protein [Clostridia bacterium]
MMTMLDNLTIIQPARTKRVSSYDQTGRNSDFWILEAGERRVLCDIRGPGKITHIWMTQDNLDTDFFRKVTLSFFWDDEETPSILTPLGDFFCLGHSISNSFQSLPFSVSARENNTFGGMAALNCYLPMPFNTHARIEIFNETTERHRIYFNIDYELADESFGTDVARLHAQFRRENPTTGWGPNIGVNTPQVDIPNLTDANNYLLLEAEGAGQFIGFNLSVTNLTGHHKRPHQRAWWGEGDEMFFIDGEPWPPSVHGTGSEDALCHAYGMQRNAYLFYGSSLFEPDTGGYQTSYVFYIANPVRFRQSIRASIEHGHANHLSNDYASVAYWYQREPHIPFGILPVKQRVPLIQTFAFPEGSKTPFAPVPLTPEMKAAHAEWNAEYAKRQEPGS